MPKKVTLQEARCAESRLELVNFVQYYLHKHIPLAIPLFHAKLYDLFNILEHPRGVRRLLDIEPRGYGKSVRWSFFYPLWLFVTRPYGRPEQIQLLSNTAELAERNLRWIYRELESNEMLKEDWGDLLDQATIHRTDLLELPDGDSISAKGQGAQIRGFHPTQVVIDDLENREDAKNKNLRDKLEEYFNADVLGALEKDARLAIIGTIVHQEGLLNTLHNDEGKRTEGWIKKKKSVFNDDGSPCWPEKDTLEDLMRRKEEMASSKDGTAIFFQEYCNVPVPLEEMAVSPDDIRYVDHLPCNHLDMKTVMACDPAFSEKKRACYTAFVTIGIPYNSQEHTGTIYAVGAERGKWGSLEKANAFIKHWLIYRPDEIIVEDGPGVSDFIALVSKLAAERRKVLPEIRLVKPRIDKLARAQTIAHLFEEGRVYFLNRPIQKEMEHELLLLPHGNYSDLADALVHALRRMKYWLRVGIVEESYQTAGEPYIGPGGY